MKRLYVLGIVTALTLSSLTACAAKPDSETQAASNETPEKITIDTKKLEDGGYYVRHQDGSLEPLYFGNATFDQGKTGQPSNERILWFRDDISKIPKLYAGDLLLYYSSQELSETFNFERFEDLGYTVGLCQLKLSPSGRYTISTSKDDNCTYPGSDADAILTDKNSNVTIDTIGGIELRSRENDDGSMQGTYLTRCGTLSGLKQGQAYAVQMYSGTRKLDTMNLVADVDVLGSFEGFTSHDFTYLASDDVISITIPPFMNSGWYLIDGMGVFKYIKGSQAEESSITDFKSPMTDVPEEYQYTELSQEGIGANQEIDGAKVASSVDSTFKVTAEGEFTISVTLSVPENMKNIQYDYPEASMQLTAPDGTTYPLLEDENGVFSHHFDLAPAGEYHITYYNLDNRVPHLSIA